MKHDWEYKQIGDVCEVLNGLWTGKKPPFVNVGVIRNTNFTKECSLDPSNIFYTDVEVKAYSKRKLEHGDIIIEKSGGSDKQPVGRPILFNLNGEFSFSNFTSVLRIKDVSIIPNFFHKALTGIYYQGKTRALQSKTTGIHNLDFNKYLRLYIPVPPLLIQEQICSLLDKLNLLIEKKKEQVAEFENLAQSLFYDMFGDPITNEKGWNAKTLKDVGKIITGSTPSTKNVENYNSSDFCFVKPSDIEKDSITRISKTEFYISQSAYDNSRKLPKGSVLVTCIGIVGKTGILEVDATCNQQINAIVPNAYCNSLYVAYSVLLSKRNIEAKANAPVVPIINKGEFSKISIPIPPLSLQKAFAEKVEAIERQKELINQSIKDVQTLLDAKMDYYFGE